MAAKPQGPASAVPYTVRQFTPAHPDLANGAGVPASLTSEHYVEALARVVYVWGHPLVNVFGRTSTWELMKGKGPGMAMGLFPGSPKNWMGFVDDYLPAAQRKATLLYQGAKGRGGSRSNPFVPASLAEFQKIPAGSYFIDDDGTVLVKK